MPTLPPGAGSFKAALASPSPQYSTAARSQSTTFSSAETAKQAAMSTRTMFEPMKQWTAATFEAKQWAAAASPSANKSSSRQRSRPSRATPTASPAPIPNYAQPTIYAQQTTRVAQPTAAPTLPPPTIPMASVQVPRAPLPTAPQALITTYASRLRTGATLLMQPILASTSAAGVTAGRTGTRRGGVVNYAEPGSDEEPERSPDAGERDQNSEDSDFVASGGTRTAVRASRTRTGANGFYQYNLTGSPAPQALGGKPSELDQSYLGLVPPSRYMSSKRADATKHDYPSQEALDLQAAKPSALVPVRVEFETETHRIRDCFLWNLHDGLTKPEAFARIFCADLDLPLNPWQETVANQIRAQLEEYEGLASMDLGSGVDGYVDPDEATGDVEVSECRVILSIDVQIATFHLLDHIEWDLLSPLTPEAFAVQLCADIGLTGEAASLIAHALQEEILKHKKDAIEWGFIGGELTSVGGDADDPTARGAGFGVPVKDKTGLGLGAWGRPPRDGLGRGPRALKSVWKDWNDSDEYAPRFELLTAEEVERREIERERASRRLRRETSKFQFSSTRRRR